MAAIAQNHYRVVPQREDAVLTPSLADAALAAEQIIAQAPHVQTEQVLLGDTTRSRRPGD